MAYDVQGLADHRCEDHTHSNQQLQRSKILDDNVEPFEHCSQIVRADFTQVDFPRVVEFVLSQLLWIARYSSDMVTAVEEFDTDC